METQLKVLSSLIEFYHGQSQPQERTENLKKISQLIKEILEKSPAFKETSPKLKEYLKQAKIRIHGRDIESWGKVIRLLDDTDSDLTFFQN